MNIFDSTQPAGKQLTVNLSNSTDITFVWCPNGIFEMGRNTDEGDYVYGFESPKITVELTHGFWIAETPLTREQVSVLGHHSVSRYEHSIDSPASQFTWQEAIKICNLLNTKLYETNNQNLFKNNAFTVSLPTEAQWEYACRASTNDIWHFGNNINFWLAHGTHKKGVGILPSVKQKLPNLWGLYDLYGMVYEWCLDRPMAYKLWFNRTNPLIDDSHPQVQAHKKEVLLETRIVRGGCIDSRIIDCTSSSRGILDVFNSQNDLTGIRPVINKL